MVDNVTVKRHDRVWHAHDDESDEHVATLRWNGQLQEVRDPDGAKIGVLYRSDGRKATSHDADCPKPEPGTSEYPCGCEFEITFTWRANTVPNVLRDGREVARGVSHEEAIVAVLNAVEEAAA